MKIPVLVLGLVTICGCVRWQRDPEFYASELSERLEGRSEAIAGCYDGFLAEHPSAGAGALVVEFDIAKKTGEVTDIEVDTEQSSVPEPLTRCVIAELSTLRMDPPDAKAAHAIFEWSFVPGPAKKPPADPFVEAQTVLLGCYERHLAEIDSEATGDLVIDYAFDRATGALERFDIVADATTAPELVVACAKPSFEAARLEPDDLDDRNSAGRRSFALRYTPHDG